MNAQDVIRIARAEVGYLEKRSNANLDSKTGNAGMRNYTKYWRDLKPVFQAQPWCDAFVSWCTLKACGGDRNKADQVLCGGLDSFYTPVSAQKYKSAGRWSTVPHAGDQIFFKNSKRIYHTGIVTGVTKTTVLTIEGNTGGGRSVIANGGGVHEKAYAIGNSRIAGYGRPLYDAQNGSESNSSAQAVNPKSTPPKPHTSENTCIQDAQSALNRIIGAGLAVDNIRGGATKRAVVKLLQHCLNKDYGAGLAVDGIAGRRTLSAIGRHYVKRGEKQWLVTWVEVALKALRYYIGGIETPGIFGGGLYTAVVAFQKANGLSADGIAGANTLRKLLSKFQ